MGTKIEDERELTLKVALVGAKPPIWRRVVVRERMTLAQFHAVIQAAMGWYDSHLHEFEVKGRTYTTTDDDDFPSDALDSEGVSLRDLRLRRRGTRFRYLYDFGDDWDHSIEVEAVEPVDPSATYPRCLAGRRACPPEDCGGIHGYARMLAIVANTSHPEHSELAEWMPEGFDPERFDLELTNWILSRLSSRRKKI
jgi:hypothetical protein